jgi:hypothetical protein
LVSMNAPVGPLLASCADRKSRSGTICSGNCRLVGTRIPAAWRALCPAGHLGMTGNHGVRGNIVLSQLVPEIQRQIADRRLGRHVRLLHAARPRHRQHGAARNNVDDAAAILCDHRPHETADYLKGAEDVDLKHLFPVGIGRAENGCSAGRLEEVVLKQCRVIDQRIDGAKARDRRVVSTIQCVIARNIGFEAKEIIAVGFEFLAELPNFGPVLVDFPPRQV